MKANRSLHGPTNCSRYEPNRGLGEWGRGGGERWGGGGEGNGAIVYIAAVHVTIADPQS